MMPPHPQARRWGAGRCKFAAGRRVQVVIACYKYAACGREFKVLVLADSPHRQRRASLADARRKARRLSALIMKMTIPKRC